MPKKVILTEEQMQTVVSMMKQEEPAKQYPIDPELVLIVKAFLDSNYVPFTYYSIGADGLQHGMPVVKVLGSDDKDPILKYKEDLHEILISRFKNIYLDKDRRRKFLGQVMKDWYNNKIGLYGSLSVNHY